MDVLDINNVFVAKDCARTNGGPETIDGDATSGVQIHAPLIDAGTAAATYYGAGELVITDVAGKVLNATTANNKAIEAICIHQRSADGLHHYGYKALKGANITSYNLLPYKAPVEQVVVMHTITTTIVAGTTYMIKIRRIGSEMNAIKYPTVRTASYTALTGDDAADVYAGLIATINKNFANDVILPITAASTTGGDGNGILLTAKALPWELGKFFYKKLNFTVELVNLAATVVTNLGSALTFNTVSYGQATKGIGNYQQVAEAELFGKLYTGANKFVQSPNYRRNIVPIDAVSTETYDTVVINWTNVQGGFSDNVRQEGSVTIFLPVTNNATNQVSAASTGILHVLDAYIVTCWGVGAVQDGKQT